MGWKRSHEIIEYKEKIINAICNNPKLVRLLAPDAISNIDDEDFDAFETISYKYLLPYTFIPGTQTEVGRYLMFSPIFSSNNKNKTLKNMTITFTIICHNSIIRYDDKKLYPERKGHYSCWWDLVLCELDEIFCGEESDKLDFGVGKFEISYIKDADISYAREIPYIGIEVTIKNKDFTDGYSYGK